MYQYFTNAVIAVIWLGVIAFGLGLLALHWQFG